VCDRPRQSAQGASDHFCVPHRAYFLPGVASFEHYLFSVLAVLGHRFGLASNLAIERNRAAGHCHSADERMIEIHQIAIEASLLARQYLLMRSNFSNQDVRVVQFF